MQGLAAEAAEAENKTISLNTEEEEGKGLGETKEEKKRKARVRERLQKQLIAAGATRESVSNVDIVKTTVCIPPGVSEKAVERVVMATAPPEFKAHLQRICSSNPWVAAKAMLADPHRPPHLPAMIKNCLRRGLHPNTLLRSIEIVSPAMANLSRHACGHCGELADHKCERCRHVYYCNRDCQRVAWPLHKLTCKNKTVL